MPLFFFFTKKKTVFWFLGCYIIVMRSFFVFVFQVKFVFLFIFLTYCSFIYFCSNLGLYEAVCKNSDDGYNTSVFCFSKKIIILYPIEL